MKERIKKIYDQIAGDNKLGFDSYLAEKFAELIVSEAFRAGVMYAAKKYEEVKDDRFTGNDVAMFLEMEAGELSDDDIQKHFGIE